MICSPLRPRVDCSLKVAHLGFRLGSLVRPHALQNNLTMVQVADMVKVILQRCGLFILLVYLFGTLAIRTILTYRVLATQEERFARASIPQPDKSTQEVDVFGQDLFRDDDRHHE